MPNHVHGIVVIGNNIDQNMIERKENVSSISDTTDRTKMYLSKIVHGVKSTISRIVRKQFDTRFAWHKSFYDHIIRDDTSLNTIREYIRNNPLNWNIDRNNLENLLYMRNADLRSVQES